MSNLPGGLAAGIATRICTGSMRLPTPSNRHQSNARSVTVAGNTIKWSMNITVPMPMTLTNEATIDGDTITGTVTAGAFGSFPLTGTRVA
jgi:hypothetical protein